MIIIFQKKEEIAIKIVLYCLLAITLLIAYLFLDYKLGRKRKRHDKGIKEFPERNSDIHLFTEGTNLFNDMFQEIRDAKKHIHILFYICKNDGFGQQFLQLIKQKAKEGVEVRLLLDWIGSFGLRMKRKEMKELKQSGVQLFFSNKLKGPFYFYTSQTRNHRKVTVIDGEIGYMGGFNIGNEYISLDPVLTPWRDYHLKISGEGVQDLQAQFLWDWSKASNINLLQNTIYFPPLFQGSVHHRLCSTEGFLLEETFSTYIKQAQSSIIIGSPYFIPSATVFRELLSALDRGVTIQIVVPFESDHAFVKEASFPFLRKLLEKGGNVYQYKKGFYHAKVLVIDDLICDLGTANFDNRSFFLNCEMNCFIYQKELLQHVKEVLCQDIENSERLLLSDLKKYSFSSLIKEWIGSMIKHFL